MMEKWKVGMMEKWENAACHKQGMLGKKQKKVGILGQPIIPTFHPR
jgi:hypothetical protein